MCRVAAGCSCASARAAKNRARYPHAGDGGELPPLTPEEVDLLSSRMMVDFDRENSTGGASG
ncbi:hypothetical protein [Streptomyces sp. NPDC046182]|uniref:hypothetical protein n=1 Tax=Streptomyces sp. NPDC046182 TaxID=3154601 RepID=UPI0033D82694